MSVTVKAVLTIIKTISLLTVCFFVGNCGGNVTIHALGLLRRVPFVGR